MHATHLHEHDANQGAKSSGEFLGMTGNCGWYLLGASGVTILMVIFLWGLLGVSLWFCLLVGAVLCGGALTYVFALKNNRPEHYDTDFFESALVEAGVMTFRFGPRVKSPANPFRSAPQLEPETASAASTSRSAPASRPAMRAAASAQQTGSPVAEAGTERKRREEPVVTRAAFDHVVERLAETEAMLEDTLAETAEGRV
jgi:hypothetical protein